jgi:hypothetical protein
MNVGSLEAGKLLPSLQLILGAVSTPVTFGTLRITLAAFGETVFQGNNFLMTSALVSS